MRGLAKQAVGKLTGWTGPAPESRQAVGAAATHVASNHILTALSLLNTRWTLEESSGFVCKDLE